MSNLAAKLKSAFEAGEFCDVGLTLKSGTVIKCHSVVLKINGDFFKCALNPVWISKEVPKIDCSLFPDNIVVNMINFIYGTDLSLDLDSIEGTIRCSDYFGMEELKNRCVDFLIDKIACSNVFFMLNIGDRYSLLELKTKCFDYIDTNAETLFTRYEEFYTTPFRLILELVSRDSLSVHEELLFDNLMQWVDQQPEDKAALWHKLSKHICFLRMSLDYFVCHCIPQNVVDSATSNKILIYLSSLNTVDFENEETATFKIKRCVMSRNDVLVKRFFRKATDNSWDMDEMNGDRIVISVTRDSLLKAVSLYGKAGESFIFTVSVHETDTGALIQKSKCRMDFESDSQFLPFKVSVRIARNKRYTIIAMKEGPNTCCGVHGLTSSKIDMKDGCPLEILFHDSNTGSSTVNVGQFEGFLFMG